MGFWSSVCSVCSSVFRSACSAIGAIGKVALETLSLPSRILGSAIQSICSFAGLHCGKPKEESPEELGEKAMISPKKPADFANTEEYIKHLRNDIQVDREKMEKFTPDERLERQALGTSIYMKQIEDKFDTKLPLSFFETVGKLEMPATAMKSYIDSFKKNGISDMGKMSDYLKGKLDPKEVPEVDKAIKEGAVDNAQKQNEKKTTAEINSDILDMQAIMRETNI